MNGYYVKVLMDDLDVIELRNLNPDEVHFINFKGKRYNEVRHGKWIPSVDKWGDIITTVNGYTCSECGAFNADKDNYCPNCGARMVEKGV